ncbi:hypothetical protein [Chromohalobacter sp. HP20-39]|uniref:hypothetical protein n=1 Tax=Chromohalobacter sp. HP20-39 TaxID=3079306 RepID=UPI00294B3A7F|nr:hypothetical protein [Chromohalobacter sp. HP20-39]MDV6317663.1 hypothetical protein [Chromohalobacter sp. HP20-39]
MTLHESKRHTLMGRLSRQVLYTTPMLLLMSAPLAAQAVADDAVGASGYTSLQGGAPLMANAEGEAEGEGEGEGEAEGEGSA